MDKIYEVYTYWEKDGKYGESTKFFSFDKHLCELYVAKQIQKYEDAKRNYERCREHEYFEELFDEEFWEIEIWEVEADCTVGMREHLFLKDPFMYDNVGK